MIVSKNINLHVTEYCNSFCNTCNNWKKITPHHSNLSMKIYEKIFHEFKQLNNQGQVNIVGWGEPTMYPQLLDVIKIIKDAGLKVLLLTNGINFNKLLINKLINLKINQLNFSLNSHIPQVHDWSRNYPGNCNHIINMIKEINNRFPVCINTILSNWNYKHFLDYISFLKTLPITQISFNLEYNRTKFNSEIKKLIPILLQDNFIYSGNNDAEDYYRIIDNVEYPLKNPCKIAKTRINIDIHGNIYLCDCSKFGYILGNLNKENFKNILQKKITQSIMKKSMQCHKRCAINNCNF